MAFLETDDLAPFAAIDDDKAADMIADAEALAGISAPCLRDPSSLEDWQTAAVKAVLRAAVLRWADSGNGAVSSQSVGPFAQTIDTRQPRRTMFWPSEISALQRICKGTGGAFSIDTAAAEPMRSHSVFFGNQDGVQQVGAVAFDDDTDSYFGEL